MHINILKFSSADELQAAFLDGVQSYLEVATILDNKSAIAKRLGKHIHDHQISGFGKEQAGYWQQEMSKDSTIEHVINTLDLFVKRQQSSAAITSLSTFIYLACFHQASIANIDGSSQQDPDATINLSGYFHNIAKGTTGLKNTLKAVENYIKLLLMTYKNQPERLFINNKTNLKSISSEDKLLLSVYHLMSANSTPHSSRLLESLFSSQEIEKFKNYHHQFMAMQGPHSTINNLNSNKNHELYQYFLQSSARMTFALEQYINKFTMKAGDSLTEYLPKKIPSMGIDAGATSALNIIMALTKYSFKSKGYGYIHRHGIEGQTRAYLLKNLLKNAIIFCSRQIESYATIDLKHSQDRHEAVTNYILAFHDNFKSEFKHFPNHKQNGSLAYYLSMYANPENEFKSDDSLHTQWLDDKLNKDSSVFNKIRAKARGTT
ncbi:MAG: hypothetical protein ACO2ZM_03375 [Francisellaceae bacterium]